ncbi:hypothetical protein L6164_028805 [Bauhinia variegata]|uniref:Uncharacterized protein n=1 Tax=Bauhinia variegata TaxID=167791 RepID=A0ACB9L7A6_BAUVA|nr:hypothetical protein L6164_028805 [Bauhinia variegata]
MIALNNDMYITEYGSLAKIEREDLGSTEEYRYPDDVYDRFWDWDVDEDVWNTLDVSIPDDSLKNNNYKLPKIVMSTLVTPVNASSPLSYSWTSRNASDKYYVYLYFAELQQLAKNETRSFNVIINGQPQNATIVPQYLSVDTYSSKSAISGESFKILLVRTDDSTLPPILNAIEIYKVKEFPLPETDREDYDAITRIQSTYGLTKNWQGDPCSPIEFLWDGLNCTYDGYNFPRITTLNLSSSGLTGTIAHSISDQVGEVVMPMVLSQLEFLKTLNLENNNLTGPLCPELIENQKGVYCQSVVTAPFWVLKRRKPKPDTTIEKNPGDTFMEIQKRQYSYFDLIKITNNFERVLGKGGFGTVYYGIIDDKQVAVKMLSPSSAQGYQEFQAEVKLLMTVHHRNLTSLIGYCNEETNKGLIYEYMANGNLQEHLSGMHSKARLITWEDRLRISIDVAHGLEYLHNGYKPPIIHRDIKSTNILLNECFQAKLSDFGLSKTMPSSEGGNQLSSLVGGTPGYVNPKSSVWKAVELAMACLSLYPKRRPTMSEVVIELNECLATVLPRTTIVVLVQQG